MANEFRRPIDEFFGTISAGITALETTLQSEQFARLDDLYSTALYLPLVLADDTTQVIEVVYVRAHQAGSNAITVLRGQEGTTARQWPGGTTFRAAPTVRDGAQSLTDTQISALPNPHTGMRVVSRDSGLALERSGRQGFLPAVAYAKGGVNVDAYDAVVPADVRPILRAGHRFQQTQGGTGDTAVSPPSGGAFWDLPGGPPANNIIAVTTSKLFPSVSHASFSQADFWGIEKSASNWRLWFACVDGANALMANGRAVNFSIMALVY